MLFCGLRCALSCSPLYSRTSWGWTWCYIPHYSRPDHNIEIFLMLVFLFVFPGGEWFIIVDLLFCLPGLPFPILYSEPAPVPYQHIVSYQGLIEGRSSQSGPPELCTWRRESLRITAHSTRWKDELLFENRNTQRVSIPLFMFLFYVSLLTFFFQAHPSWFILILMPLVSFFFNASDL